VVDGVLPEGQTSSRNSVELTTETPKMLPSVCAPSASRLGMGKNLGGDTAGTADPTDQRDIPHHMMLCSAIKAV